MENETNKDTASKGTKDTGKINLTLIASGSGTDANSIMEAWEGGCIPEINPPLLISTKKGAGCLEKARGRGVRSYLLDYKDSGGQGPFNRLLGDIVRQNFTDLIFLVGCIIKIYPVEGVDMYNIHPADPVKHGGDKMYGLAVHRHVLEDIRDQVDRGKKKATDPFYTYPTVHGATEDYDGGAPLLRQAVQILPAIVEEVCLGQKDPQKTAKDLQDLVLPYEWLMLPAAVRMAARRILRKK